MMAACDAIAPQSKLIKALRYVPAPVLDRYQMFIDTGDNPPLPLNLLDFVSAFGQLLDGACFQHSDLPVKN
jgi:hypothetical protein